MKSIRCLQVTLALIVLSTAQMAVAKIDLSSYQLTQKQIEVIQRFTEKGYSDEALTHMAQTFQRTNTRPAMFVPTYSTSELYAVMSWAEGHAYVHFASRANVKFDEEAFLADCPNQALFGFGRATGATYLPVDVLWQFNNTFYALNHSLQQNPGEFRGVYLEYIRNSQFAKYINANDLNRLAELETN